MISDELYEPILGLFDGNIEKALEWFDTDNPIFGNVSPMRMVELGKEVWLQAFINDAVDYNALEGEAA